MDRLRHLMRSKWVAVSIAMVVVVAGVVVGVTVTRASATYPINAVYASAPGLFPGAAVDVLGVPVGTVTSVKNVDNEVDVVMQVQEGTKIPSDAEASLVAPEVLGQPDVDLNPGFTGGPHLASGATIPESRTTVPVSTDQLLKQLQRTLNALNPHAVGDLITNLAQDLDGQGAGLNQLIGSAAGTIQLLANKGDDLGQLDGTLAQLTGTLDSDSSQIVQLVKEYDTVSTVIAQHSGQLNDAITQLSGATTSLVTLLTPNLQPLEADVGTVTTVGRTLDRNISNVDEILAQANNLFQGAQRVFDPTYNWLDLNVALPVGVSGDYIAGLIRDRLAGVCRRLAANHSTGLSATVLASLTSCGDPNSDFFDPLINEIPTILSALSTGAGPTTVTGLLQQGLNQIGSIGSSTTPAPSASAGAATGGTSGSSGGTTTTVPPTTTTTTPGSSCGLLGMIVGCSSGSSTSSSSTAPSGSSSSGGLGGLLSQDVTPTKSQQATVNLASNSTSGPSLSTPAARLLPPLPSAHHARPASRGLLSQWAHDVGSLL
jgi:phospholipid/cholesterol/gamma-HCH transport system substrate-binding protein